MFLPNVIGEHVMGELAANTEIIGAGVVAATLGTSIQHEVQIASATLKRPISAFRALLTSDSTLTAPSTWAYGTFIDGTHKHQEGGQQFNISASARFQFTSLAEVQVALCFGRLNTGETLTVNTGAPVNAISNWWILPARIQSDGEKSIYASYQGSFIDGQFQTAQAYSDRPVGLYWLIHQDNGSGGTLRFMDINGAIFNYVEGVDVFNPRAY
ncbi:hypothetical protein [Eel River basin pequenovirus]|nr:hypothetical protein [Eel River basin pequenovirus]